MINVADLVDPGDAAGRTYRQINHTKKHHIPIGTLAEITFGRSQGVRLFVCHHNRDCDETPMYVLSPRPNDTEPFVGTMPNPGWIGGYTEHDLKIIEPPREEHEEDE